MNPDLDTPATTTHLLESLKDGRNNKVWLDFDLCYRPIIHRLARRRGLNDDQAAEVSQLTLFAFYEAHLTGRFDPSKGRLRAFILTIANARIADMHRLRGRREYAAGQSAIETVAENPRVPMMRTTFLGVTSRPLDMLRSNGHLSEQTIRVFELTVLHGIPARTAATMCGISEDNVYLAKHRALRHLRAILDK